LTIASIKGGGLAVRTSKGVLDVVALEAAIRKGLPLTTDELIAGGGNIAALSAMVAAAEAGNSAVRPYLHRENMVQFAPAVGNPEKIICVGLNYKAHIAESGENIPIVPVLFNKYRNSLNNHQGQIFVSGEKAKRFDYEAELVIVIGKTAHHVPVEHALEYVFGYASGQDFTARDLQMATSQWMIGKCGDGWGPVGPWIVGADLVNPDNLQIECLVNGEIRQSSNTSRMIFDCAKLVSFASEHMTLRPGDIIFTGTPEGTIFGMPKDQQVWLKAGDRITTRIQRLGDLEVALT
jgi:2-keto-4-pentenoate hydratase/2-oxohepta-3-ene-1,7-dioic acid hydratase in catechol pathway